MNDPMFTAAFGDYRDPPQTKSGNIMRNAGTLLTLATTCCYAAKDEWNRGKKDRAHRQAVLARDNLINAIAEMNRQMEPLAIQQNVDYGSQTP